MNTFTATPLLFAFLSMASFGLTDFTAAVYSRKTNPWGTAILNQFWGLILISLIMFFGFPQLKVFDVSKGELTYLALAGFFNFLAITSLIKGMFEGNVGLVSGVASAFGIIVAFMSHVLLGEKLSLVGWLFVILSTLGVVSSSYEKNHRNNRFNLSKGIPYAIFSMFCWGISIFLMISISRETDWTFVTFYNFFVGSLCSIILFFIVKPILKHEKFFYILVLSVIFEICAYYALNKASVYPNAGIVGAIIGSYAIITLSLSRLLLRESLNTIQKAGFIMILIGIVGINLYGQL